MELQKPGARIGFSPEFKRELVEKIVVLAKTLGDLADEMGIPPEVMRKWTLMVERTETDVPIHQEPSVPAWRVRQLERELEDLRRIVDRQAAAIRRMEAGESGGDGSV